jgi:elongation factor G
VTAIAPRAYSLSRRGGLQVSEQQIPEVFLPGVIDGIREAALQERPGRGVLSSLRVTVIGGSYHPVDSSQRAFAKATVRAFEDALAKAELRLTEVGLR